jgi:hypothetical protein
MEIQNKKEAVISLLNYIMAFVSTMITVMVGARGSVFVANVLMLPNEMFTNKFVFITWLIIIMIGAIVGIGIFAMQKFYNIGYFFYLKCQKEDGSQDTD